MVQIIEVLQGGQPVNVQFPDDMSLDDIAEALQGFPPSGAVDQTFATPDPVIPPVEDQSIFRSFADVPLKIGSGIALGVKGIAEAFGADSEVAQNIQGIEGYLDSLLSAQSRADSAEIARLQTEAQDKGFLDQAKAALKGISVAPIDFAAQTLGTALPVIAATAAAGLAGLPTAAVGIGTGSLMGTGIVKGSIFDVVEGELLKANVPPEEAESVAQEAQSYQGGNLDQIGLGAILGAWAARSGIEPAIARMLSRNIAQRGIFQGAVVGAATEAVPEAFQGAQEQLARNLAQIREEQIEDVPLYRGVAGAGTLEGLAGGIGGGVFGAASSGAAPQPQLPTTEDLSEITQPEDIVTPDLPATEPTPDLSEDTTLPPLEDRLSLIAPNLRGTLKGRGLDDVGLELAARLDPKALQGMRDPDQVDAIFDPDLNTIFLGADRIKGFEQMDTPQLQREFGGLVDHEMVHAVKRMNLWKDSEWKVLENAARRRTNSEGRTYMEAALNDYNQETSEIQTEEAVAELIRDTLSGRTGLAGQPLSLIQRFVEFFRKMGNSLTGTGYASFNQVVNDIETGVTGGRPRVAQPQAEATIIGEPALASRKKVGYLPSADPLTILRSEGKIEVDGSDPLSTFFAKKAAKQAGYDNVAEYKAAVKLDQESYEKYADDPLAVREALVKGENPFGEKNEFKLREEALSLIDKEILGFTAMRDPKYYKSLKETMVGTKRRPEPFQGVYENVLSTEMTKDEFIEEFDEMFNLGSTSERATRQGISVVPSKPLASRMKRFREENPDYTDRVYQDPRTRQKRAKEQGFDTERVYYHGTADNFLEFNPLRTQIGPRQGTGVYLSDNPYTASTYTDEGRSQPKGKPRRSPQVLPLYTRLKNPIIVYADGNFWNGLGPEIKVDVPKNLTGGYEGYFTLKEIMPSEEDVEAQKYDEFGNVRPIPSMGGPLLWDTNEIARWARQQPGVDGVIFEDIIDVGVTIPRGVKRSDYYKKAAIPSRNLVIFDAENIRSVNAEFEPRDTKSTQLMASRKRLPLTPQEQELSGRAILESGGRYDEDTANLITRPFAELLDARVQSIFGKNLADTTPENKEIISNVMVDEALSELDAEGNAVGWYKQTLVDMMDTFNQMYPIESQNPENVSLFKLALAITSNGADVKTNTQNALSIFDEYIETGKIPLRGFGDKSAAMKQSFQLFDSLVEKAGGSKEKVFDLINLEGTVRDIKKLTGKQISQENADTVLPYSAIFGPKIGIFYQNLNGNYEPLTVDRWFMKTWGRYTGTNIPDFNTAFPKRAKKLREEIKKLPRLKGYRKDKLMRDDDELMRFAKEKVRAYAKTNFQDKTPLNMTANNLIKGVADVKVAPTSGGERTWIREVTNEAVNKLRNLGVDIDPATLQALLWYAEKKIYSNHGITDSRSEPTDYATEIKRIAGNRARPSGRSPDDNDRRSADRVGRAGRETELESVSRVRQQERDTARLKTKPEDSAALAVDQSKAATEVRGNPEADQASAEELRTVKKLASRSKASDIVTSTAYNRVADVASKRAARGQGNINNALPYEMPSSADDRGIVYQLQDKYIDLKNATETVKANQRNRGLTPLKDTENPYLGEESMHGIIGNKFNRFQQDEITPLAKKLVATKIPRKELEEFLVLRHAVERNENVRNLNAASKNPRPELADGGAGSLNGQRLVDSYVKSEMQNKYGLRWNDSTNSWEGGNRRAVLLNDLAGDFDAITRGTLQELKDSGLISQDSLDKLNTHYKYYAPLRGVSPDEDIAIEEHSRISRGANNLSIGGIETEKATGRVSEAMPPLGQIIFQRQNAIRRGTINDVVGQRMLNVIREHPNDNYWKIHEDRSYAGVAGNELFGVKENGKQYFVEFKDKRLRDAMLSLDAAQTGKILGFLRGVNRYMSAVLTSYNPDFVAPNFVRDLGTAINNLVGEQTMVGGKAVDTDGLIGKVIADVGPSVREVYRGLRGKKLNKKLEQDWKDYLESGAKTEWFHVKSPDESSRDIDDLIAMAQGTFKGNMKAGKDAVAGFVSDVNGAIENGVRFATFKNARDLFIKNGDSREEAVAKAATLAKNLTVNFNRKGNSGELLNGLYLFFNASVQGTANFLRGMSSPAKQRMLLAMASFGSLVTYLNEMVSEEDEDGKSVYANLPSFVKERNLVLMRNINPFYEGSGDPPYTIPLPYGYNVLHVLGVNTMETILGLISPQDAAARVSAAALGSFSPVGFGTSSNPVTFAAKGLTPQIGKPIAEILLNEDFFGSPVYTEPFEFGPNIPLANLSQRSTPDFWKNTTQFMNQIPLLGPGTGGDESRSGPLGWVSPDALHHLFGTFIGGTGRFVERTGKTAGAASDYLQGDYVEDDLSVNDIPILRRFMYESSGREGMSTYYDRKDDILVADRQAGLLKGSERGDFIRENRPLLMMKRQMESADKRIRNINKRLAAIGERILTSSSVERTIKLEEEQKRLEDLKLTFYNRFNKIFNERVGVTK